MKLKLKRFFFNEDYTVGQLFVDGEEIGVTLEDTVRENGKPVSEWKIPGKTAIPRGTYNVELTFSNRFKRVLPLLEGVEGFSGVRIHAGNKSADTEGCILVGETWEGIDWITNSRATFLKLYDLMEEVAARDGPITIEII